MNLLSLERRWGFFDNTQEPFFLDQAYLAEKPAHLPRMRLWKGRASQVILATGAIERPLVFAGNDLPGVMLASAAQTYLNQYGVLAGGRGILTTNNDAAWHSAFALHYTFLTPVIYDHPQP